MDFSGGGQATARAVPILLLKTRSSPSDAYEEAFSATSDPSFRPSFVPVLDHHFESAGLSRLHDLLGERQIGRSGTYGGLIFTSQRAVEAFSRVVDQDREGPEWPYLDNIPIYSVGPATTRALKAVSQQPPLQVLGEHTGSGDKLAPFICEHYARSYGDQQGQPPLLFLVGEQRRDIIPRILAESGIRVDELTVYATGVMASFSADLVQALENDDDAPVRWVVVFSPTGCRDMLAALDMLDRETGRARKTESAAPGGRRTLIATIGPTTRAYLHDTFGLEPDVCSEKPSPEALLKGIAAFMTRHAMTL